MAEKKRPRAHNWDMQEKVSLVTHIKDQINIIENKKKITLTNRQREQAWKFVQQGMRIDGYNRETHRLKEQWIRMKTVAKRSIAEYKRSLFKTGGGTSISEPWEYDWVIKDLIPHEFEEDISKYDSEGEATLIKSCTESVNTPKSTNTLVCTAALVSSPRFKVSKTSSLIQDYAEGMDQENAADVRLEFMSEDTYNTEMDQLNNFSNSFITPCPEDRTPTPQLATATPQLAIAAPIRNVKQSASRKLSEYEEKMYMLNKRKVELAMKHAEELHSLQKIKLHQDMQFSKELHELQMKGEKLLQEQKLKSSNFL